MSVFFAICTLAGFLLLLQAVGKSMLLSLLREYKRKKLLSVQPLGKGSRFLNIAQVDSIGWILDCTNENDLASAVEIAEFVKEFGIPFHGLVVANGKCFKNEILYRQYEEKFAQMNISILGKKQMNWVGVPKIPLKDFMEREYSMFLLLNPNNNFTSDFLSLKVKAQFMVGMHNNAKLPYTFVLEPDKEEFSYSRYLKSLFDYLKNINCSSVRDGE